MGKYISNYDELPIPNKKIYDLVQEQTNGSVKAFAEIIGVSQQVLDRIFKIDSRNGKYPSVSEKIKVGLKEKFGIDEIWLLTDEKSNTPKPSDEASPIDEPIILRVPLVSQYAQAGYLCGYADAAYMATLPTIPYIVDHEAQGHYVAFEVKGDSMNDGTEDAILEGDRLLCREIMPHLWVSSKLHFRKWDFVIVHTEGILVKRIIDHDVENHTITIHSLNSMYPDKIINLADVKQIFNVIELQRPRRR
ncbi:helix-turn-helix transcriptional regulator [Phocaeicola sp.]|uniref:S24 family peptidase n=1 Tax=Phocaeicola sp. TaxID=2773926 RepID=UPI0038686F8E